MSLSADFFTGSFYHNKTIAYWTIVDSIERNIRQKYPETWNSVQSYLQKLDDHSNDARFDLINGDVQSGKSRAIMIVAWICSFRLLDKVPVVLTINLDSVRKDFIGKASPQGEINKVICDTFKSIDFQREIIGQFSEVEIKELSLSGGFESDALVEWFSLKAGHIKTRNNASVASKSMQSS